MIRSNPFGFVLAPLLMLAIALVAGCGALEKIETAPMTSRLVTDQITLRFIAGANDPVERAEGVRAVIDKIRGRVNGEKSYTLAEINQAVQDAISWDSLSLADQNLLRFGLGNARVALAKLIGEGVVDPDERQTIGMLLTWIDDAAARVQ